MINERKKSNQFLQSTIDALNSSLAILDEDGCIMMTNRPWRQFADANQDTGGKHRNEQVGSTIRNERKREAGRRHDAECDSDMEKRSDTDERREAQREQRAKPVTAGTGDPEGYSHVNRKQQNQNEPSQESPA